LQAYLAYYDSSSANASERKYKYAATSDLAMDSSVLTKDKGYWLYANQTGNLTLPGVGGALANETYLWRKLRFYNGTEEKNVTDAGLGGEGWINEDDIRYWEKHPIKGTYEFLYISGTPGLLTKTNISSWEGFFVYSNQDNITLIRQN
jgi:hypothetical protein